MTKQIKGGKINFVLILALVLLFGCSATSQKKIPLVLDTDANHGVDDQPATAYAIFRQDVFDIRGMTSNVTPGGGTIDGFHNELVDIVALCGAKNQFPIAKGPDFTEGFEDFEKLKNRNDFEGIEAVNLIINAANAPDISEDNKLIVVAIGRSTNMALAIYKDPSIISKVTYRFMGTGFPEEMNLTTNGADAGALKQIFNSGMEIHITPRWSIYQDPPYGLMITHKQMKSLEGQGLVVDPPVYVRSRKASFDQFGDWALNRWNNGDVPNPKQMWDFGALLPITKPNMATGKEYGAPDVVNGFLVKRPDNKNRVTVWSDFDRSNGINHLLETVINSKK